MSEAAKQSHLTVVKNGAHRTTNFIKKSAKFIKNKTVELVKSPEFKTAMITSGIIIGAEVVILGSLVALGRVNSPGSPYHGMRGWEAMKLNGMKPFDPPIIIDIV